MFRLEWTGSPGAEIFRLGRGQLGQLGAELVEMQLGDLFVEMFRQNIYFILVFAVIGL
jgi:hypothetical protein